MLLFFCWFFLHDAIEALLFLGKHPDCGFLCVLMYIWMLLEYFHRSLFIQFFFSFTPFFKPCSPLVLMEPVCIWIVVRCVEKFRLLSLWGSLG